MLACFWATKRLRSFLWGMNYRLRTDHKPLVNILTTKGSASDRTSHRINRWSSRMLEYNFNVEYLQGINNVVADCLSRLPLQAQPEVERGSSVGRTPDSQSREPGFESPVLPFRSLGIFFHFTTPQSTQLYK